MLDYQKLTEDFKKLGATVYNYKDKQKDQLWISFLLYSTSLHYDNGSDKCFYLEISSEKTESFFYYKSWYKSVFVNVNPVTSTYYELIKTSYKLGIEKHPDSSFRYVKKEVADWLETYKNGYTFQSWYNSKIPHIVYAYYTGKILLEFFFTNNYEIQLIDKSERDTYCYLYPTIKDTSTYDFYTMLHAFHKTYPTLNREIITYLRELKINAI